MDLEAVRQRAGQVDVYAVVVLAVAQGDHEGTLRQGVLPDAPVQDQLVGRHLHALGAGGDLVQQQDGVFAVALLVGQDVRRQPHGARAALVGIDQAADLHLAHLGQADIDDFIAVFVPDMADDLGFAHARRAQAEDGMLDIVLDVEFDGLLKFTNVHLALLFAVRRHTRPTVLYTGFSESLHKSRIVLRGFRHFFRTGSGVPKYPSVRIRATAGFSFLSWI